MSTASGLSLLIAAGGRREAALSAAYRQAMRPFTGWVVEHILWWVHLEEVRDQSQRLLEYRP